MTNNGIVSCPEIHHSLFLVYHSTYIHQIHQLQESVTDDEAGTNFYLPLGTTTKPGLRLDNEKNCWIVGIAVLLFTAGILTG